MAARAQVGFLRGFAGLVACLGFTASAIAADTHKEFKYTVGPNATVSIVNEYGGISLKPSSGHQVLISATSHSDKVEVDSSQNGNRIEARTHFLQKASDQDGRIDYEVQVPADANVLIRSVNGPLRAENLKSDLTVRGDTASVDIRNIAGAHVHVQTVSGPVTLNNITDGHVEIVSVGGKVQLTSVTGSKVSVNTTSGDIAYDGDFNGGGDYSFSNHSGNIDITLPASSSVDLTARSVTGSVENDFPLQQKAHSAFASTPGRSFAGTSNSGSSSVELRTFNGKIRVKKR